MENLSKKYDERTLTLILRMLLEKFEEDSIDYNDTFDDTALDSIDETLKYLGIGVKDLSEYTFYYQLVRLNPDFETGDQIILPKLEKYEIYVDVDLVEYSTETWKHEMVSYFDNREDIEKQLMGSGDYSFWDGKMVDKDVYDSEATNEKIGHIESVKFKNEK